MSRQKLYHIIPVINYTYQPPLLSVCAPNVQQSEYDPHRKISLVRNLRANNCKKLSQQAKIESLNLCILLARILFTGVNWSDCNNITFDWLNYLSIKIVAMIKRGQLHE